MLRFYSFQRLSAFSIRITTVGLACLLSLVSCEKKIVNKVESNPAFQGIDILKKWRGETAGDRLGEEVCSIDPNSKLQSGSFVAVARNCFDLLPYHSLLGAATRPNRSNYLAIGTLGDSKLRHVKLDGVDSVGNSIFLVPKEGIDNKFEILTTGWRMNLVDSALAANGYGSNQAGGVYLIDTQTKDTLKSVIDPKAPSYGWQVIPIDDMDSDGHADLLISCSGIGKKRAGFIRSYSIFKNRVIFQMDEPEAGSAFGCSLLLIDDRDGDGKRDILVGARHKMVNGLESQGMVYCMSAANGNIIYTISGEHRFQYFGCSSAYVGDVDHDGVGDYVIGASSDHTNGEHAGAAMLFSGASKKVISRYLGDKPADQFGLRIYSIGNWKDLNNVFAVAAQGSLPGDSIGGYLKIYSGANTVEITKIKQAFSICRVSSAGYGDRPTFLLGCPSLFDDAGAVFFITPTK